jgi:hypothetical protein
MILQILKHWFQEKGFPTNEDTLTNSFDLDILHPDHETHTEPLEDTIGSFFLARDGDLFLTTWNRDGTDEKEHYLHPADPNFFEQLETIFSQLS